MHMQYSDTNKQAGRDTAELHSEVHSPTVNIPDTMLAVY